MPLNLPLLLCHALCCLFLLAAVPADARMPAATLYLIAPDIDDSLEAATAAAEAGRLQPAANDLAIGYGGPFWLRMDIAAGAAGCHPDCWIEAGPSFLNHILAFVPQPDGTYHRYKGGSMETTQLPIPYRTFIVPIGAINQEGPASVYFRVDTQTLRAFHAAIHTPAEFTRRAAWDNAIIGLLIGGLCLTGIWSLIHGIWLREPLYLIYTLYVAGTTLVYSLVLGLLKPWLPDDAFNLTLACSVALAIGLYAEVLRITPVQHHLPTLFNAFRLLSWLTAFLLVMLALNSRFSVLAPLSRYTLMAQSLFAVYVSAMLVRRGDISARYGLAAFALHAGLVGTLLIYHSVAYSNNTPVRDTMMLAIFTHAMLLKLAIVARVQAAREHRDEIQRTMLAYLRDTKKQLAALGEEVTLRIDAERELRAANQQVIHALAKERDALERQRQRFLMVLHDFRTPLAILDTNLSPHTPPAYPQLAQMQRATDSLIALVDDHLTPEQEQAATDQTERRCLNVVELMHNVERRLAPLTANHTVELFYAQPVIRLLGNHQALEMLLTNLLHNALTHTPTGTRITLLAKTDKQRAHLTVLDNGPGVSTDELPAMFAKHARGADTQGSGLGLYLVRQIALAHGGTAKAENVFPHGLRVSVEIPLA